MAVMNKLILVGSALAAVVNAIPFNPHDPFTMQQVVTETAWTTMDVMVTVWVDEQGKTISTETDAFAQAVPSSTSIVAVTPTTSVVSLTSTYVQTVTSAIPTTPSPTVAAVPSTTLAVSSATSSIAAAARQVAASDTNTCEGSGNACVGDVTHWDGGLGACGWTVDTNADMQIALPYAFMGTLSNSNPYCGRSLTILNPVSGTTVQATVGDKCMGCEGRAIDLTDVLFTAVTDGTGDGRVSGIEWWFN